jgi:hypothetical protein
MFTFPGELRSLSLLKSVERVLSSLLFNGKLGKSCGDENLPTNLCKGLILKKSANISPPLHTSSA